jgi:hypothetical protein
MQNDAAAFLAPSHRVERIMSFTPKFALLLTVATIAAPSAAFASSSSFVSSTSVSADGTEFVSVQGSTTGNGQVSGSASTNNLNVSVPPGTTGSFSFFDFWTALTTRMFGGSR